LKTTTLNDTIPTNMDYSLHDLVVLTSVYMSTCVRVSLRRKYALLWCVLLRFHLSVCLAANLVNAGTC